MPKAALKPPPSHIQITLDKETFTLQWQPIDIGDVTLDAENPRIRHLVELAKKEGKPITQKLLREMIWNVHGVDDLAGKIRDNGGTLDPIWLREDGTVVEGNCRTVAYLHLNEKQPTKGKFPEISAFRLPKLSAKKIDLLLGILHVQGKLQWKAYEKAGHLVRLIRTHNLSVEKVSQTLRLKKKDVEANIGAYELMRDEYLPTCKAGEGLERFSYFLVFHTDPKLEEYRAKKSERDQFVELVKTNCFPKASSVRNYRDIIDKPAALKKLKEGKKNSFDEAMKIVAKTNPSAASKLVKRVEKLSKDLKNATAPQLESFRNATGRKLLEALAEQVGNVAKFAGKSAADTSDEE